MAEPLALKESTKRKRTAAADIDDEASQTAQPKRRKEKAEKSKVPKIIINFSDKGNPQKQKELRKSKDKARDGEVENEAVPGNQVEDEKAETDAQNYVEMVDVEKNDGQDEGEGNYIHDAWVARLGLINNFHISQHDEKFSKIAYTRIDCRNDKSVRQTENQARLESLFMKLDTHDGELTTTIARLRMEFMEPYDDIEDKLGEWSQLSLIMRLNLIESLHQVEKTGAIKIDKNIDRKVGDGEEAREQKLWTKTKLEAKRLRIGCERSQVICKDPISWSKYKPRPSRPRKAANKGGDDGDDGRGKGPDKQSASEAPKKQGTGAAPFTTPVAKTVASWKTLTFPPDKEEEFKTLLGLITINEIDLSRQPNPQEREHYAGEEYRFLYRWMDAKTEGGKTKCVDGTPAYDNLELAHKQFFTNYPFADGVQSKTRNAHAIVRNLKATGRSNEAIKAEFAKFFPKPVEKTKGAIKEENKETEHEEVDVKESKEMGATEAVALQEQEIGEGDGKDDSDRSGEDEGGSGNDGLDNPDED